MTYYYFRLNVKIPFLLLHNIISYAACKFSEDVKLAHRERENLFIVMELCHGSLEDWLFNRQKPQLDHRIVFKDILSAVSYLHAQVILQKKSKLKNLFNEGLQLLEVDAS